MKPTRLLLSISILMGLYHPSIAQAVDISQPLKDLKAILVATLLASFNHSGGNQRQAFEIVLDTEYPIKLPLSDTHSLPPAAYQAILEICAKTMPMVPRHNEINGSADISGVRITLRSKLWPASIAGVGTYRAWNFPLEEGCRFDG